MCNERHGKKYSSGVVAALLRALVAGVLLAGAQPLLAQPVRLDRIIAVVEDDVVLQSEFDERWAQFQQQLATAQGQLPPEATLKKQLLDQLILENLQLQLARRSGVRIDDNQLNQYMTALAQQNNLTFEQFRDALDAQGLYQTTREALRKEVIIGQFQNAAVNRRIDISRQEVENYLRSETGLSQIAPEYHVAHVLIPANPRSSEAQRAELADLLFAQLEQGADIVQMANARQISGIEVGGGDLGFRKPESLPSVFQDVVPTLQAGEVAKPFPSSSGMHIVQLLETRGGATMNVEQFKVRHILIKPTEIRTEEQAEELVWQLHDRIKAGENFADIARQNTNDPASMVSGGDLDWVSDDMLPPDFMAKVRETPIGSMSEPFRVSTGWHIIEVSDRRMEDLSEDNKRFQAQRILRDRKFENELQNWLTEIRDTSHVEIFEY
jgi:peptidyl-prolyl cis-trans isomerase SurA